MHNTGCDTTEKRDCIGLSNSQLFITLVTYGTRRTKCGSHHPKKIGYGIKTTQTGLGASSSQPVEDDDEADESYKPSDDEEDESNPHIEDNFLLFGSGLNLSS
ncbi:hypothetical protein M9H77_02129 [Catharanthus roseus]|uniref:Uncharacterized protein n=1 Tax=Catharanthus roseus TaxID=4058 RepID=A0ACC0C7I4_CATRO|nr:hypothetical protein M9H77_02129 [Catharanthus roseus]